MTKATSTDGHRLLGAGRRPPARARARGACGFDRQRRDGLHLGRVEVAEHIDALDLEHVPVSMEQMALATDALLTFGRGRHPARLNIGDCFAYALAKSRGDTLLFNGDDFARTDIIPAWPR